MPMIPGLGDNDDDDINEVVVGGMSGRALVVSGAYIFFINFYLLTNRSFCYTVSADSRQTRSTCSKWRVWTHIFQAGYLESSSNGKSPRTKRQFWGWLPLRLTGFLPLSTGCQK
jgi:hypothetical protein